MSSQTYKYILIPVFIAFLLLNHWKFVFWPPFWAQNGTNDPLNPYIICSYYRSQLKFSKITYGCALLILFLVFYFLNLKSILAYLFEIYKIYLMMLRDNKIIFHSKKKNYQKSNFSLSYRKKYNRPLFNFPFDRILSVRVF